MEDVKDLLSQTTETVPFQEQYKRIIKETLQDPDIHAFIEAHRSEWTKETLETSYSTFMEYIKERDARANNQAVKSPGMEPVLILNQGYADVVYRPTEAYLQHKRERQLRSRVNAMNMPKNILEARFSDVALTVERKQVIEELLSFIDAFTQSPDTFHQGLYLVGPFGVGKTYLLGALVNELAEQGFFTTILHVPTLTVEMKQAINSGKVSEKIDTIKQAHVLILDDIGAEMNSSWFRDEVLMVILQYRMQQELPTFFSSNFTVEELEDHLTLSSRGDEERMKAKHIVERIRYLAKKVRVDGMNRRQQK